MPKRGVVLRLDEIALGFRLLICKPFITLQGIGGKPTSPPFLALGSSRTSLTKDVELLSALLFVGN